ncbi:TraB/GumN family protein [Pedobacter polaris]|uniref:TraB/GumN family protein n=1 Tax=Pedobacter polaris TaxID=2571273 RepID=A0A4U1CL49_9SPHI|nr:TraB/GumN family protein [Pedobacter polaris]TKC08404.1 TraB/GumN family protein [Pedobacter polaris]
MILNLYRRSILKIAFLLLTFFAITQKSFSQTQTGYTLLWEIKGKGLTKPSYLFGTMDLKDKRAFNFSDSVYIALANTSAFAIETHPDSTAKYIPRSVKKAPKANEDNNNQEPPRMAAKGIHSIFASTYLYGLAKTNNKKVFALAEFDMNANEEETEAVDEEEELQQQEDKERLISVYAKGNLNELWGEIRQYYEEDYFTERTTELSTEIGKLLQTESIFATIGAALLPGEEGLIAKLKKAGYQLRPVGASFTDLAKTYQIDYTKMNWYTHKDNINNFSIQFPSAPFTAESTAGQKIVNYNDPIKNVIYTATALYTGPLNNNVGSTQYIDTVLNNYIKQSSAKLIALNYLDYNGLKISEAQLEKDGNYFRARLIHTNNTFYILTIENDDKDVLQEKFADLFFNSLQFTKPTAIAASNWIQYQNPAGAFSVKLPIAPEIIQKEVANPVLKASPYVMNIVVAADKVNLVNYIIRYSDYPTGMYLANKAAVFDAMFKEFETKGKVIGKSNTIYKDGYEGRATNIIIQNFLMEVVAYIKGNRTYLLIRQNMNGTEKPKNDQFLESFSFTPNMPYKEVPFNLGNITLTIPEDPLLIAKTEEEIEEEKAGESFLADEQTYFAVNKNTALNHYHK